MTTALLLLFLAVAALLAYAATRPANFTVRREIAVAAPPEAIFPFVTDFRQWALWSPYEKLDPAMQRTFGGAPSGKGACQCRGEVACPCRGTYARRYDGTRDARKGHCYA